MPAVATDVPAVVTDVPAEARDVQAAAELLAHESDNTDKVGVSVKETTKKHSK